MSRNSLVSLFFFLFPVYVSASWFGRNANARAVHITQTIAHIAKATGYVDILMVDDDITTVDVPDVPATSYVSVPIYTNSTGVPLVTVPVVTGTVIVVVPSAPIVTAPVVTGPVRPVVTGSMSILPIGNSSIAFPTAPAPSSSAPIFSWPGNATAAPAEPTRCVDATILVTVTEAATETTTVELTGTPETITSTEYLLGANPTTVFATSTVYAETTSVYLLRDPETGRFRRLRAHRANA